MKVVVAGAGAAGLEALAALAALARDRVELTLLAPDESFGYQPISAARQFALAPGREWPVAGLAAQLGAKRVRDSLAFVEDDGSLLTRDGDRLTFDALVVAVGAEKRFAPREAIHWHQDERERGSFGRLLRDLASGSARKAAFVVPRAAGWPLSAYELAIVAATAVRLGGEEAEILLITAEERPLEALGERPGKVVRKRLDDAGVRLLSGARVEDPQGPDQPMADPLAAMIGRLRRRDRPEGPQLRAGGETRPLRCDALVALPAVRGKFISGLPHDDEGFLPVDEHARVAGTSRVWAAGDATSARLKHSVVAAAQADAAAAAIAALAGGEIEAKPWEPVLHGILIDRPLSPPASVWVRDDEPLTHCLWWPPARVTGRYLAELIAARDPAARAGLQSHPNGIPVAVPVRAVPDSVKEGAGSSGRPDEMAADALSRELQALRRLERDCLRRSAEVGRDLERFEAEEREVVQRLEAAGYLRHED